MTHLVTKGFLLLLVFSIVFGIFSGIFFNILLRPNTIVAVDGQKHENRKQNRKDSQEKATLHMTNKTLKEFDVKLKTATSGQIKKTQLFPGEVSIHLDYLAHVTPRFPGVVKKIYRHIGDTVKKGDLLAIIESNDSLTPYKIKSPMSGTIIEKYLTIGESVEANSHAFELANLKTVWITFSIFQDNFGEIKQGQKAIVQSSNGKHQVQGVIDYISPTVDKHTRTQKGRIIVSNKDLAWKPGMFVDVRVIVSKIKADIVVPHTSIQKIDNKPYIFIQENQKKQETTGKNTFEPQLVQLGESDRNHIVVLSGLKRGTKYVSDGGFILKAEFEKGAIGHGNTGHIH